MTTTVKPDPKPGQRKPKSEVATKPAPPKGPRKPRSQKAPVLHAEVETRDAKGVLHLSPVGSTGIESSPDDESAPDTRQVMPSPALAKLSAAAKASAARREANANDRETAKSKRAADTAARRAEIDTWHAKVVDLFTSGKTAKEIAAENVNPKTGENYTASTINWILVKKGAIEKGAGRAKFSLDQFDDERRVEVECALATLTAAASEKGVSVTAIIKAYTKA